MHRCIRTRAGEPPGYAAGEDGLSEQSSSRRTGAVAKRPNDAPRSLRKVEFLLNTTFFLVYPLAICRRRGLARSSPSARERRCSDGSKVSALLFASSRIAEGATTFFAAICCFFVIRSVRQATRASSRDSFA